MFPEAEESRRLHVRFVHNILKIIDYAPALQSEILALITERLLKIDVQIQGDLEDLADEAEEEVVHGMSSQSRSNHDDLSDDQDSDDDMDGDDDSDPQARQAKEIKGNIEKLDILLDMLFEYYSSLFSNPNSTRFAFDALLSHFGTQIIPTYRSRHMQFLLFHFIQTTPELIDIFVGSTITMAFDTNRPTLIRQSAAAYLASFVSRGIHVPSNIVRDVFDYIGSQLTNIRLDEEPTCRGPDPRRYNTYYALTQALLYIFCFRWRDLVATQDDDLPPSPSAIMDDYDSSRPPTFIPGVKEVLSQNVFSPLNPLKVCAIPIVEQFARIAHHLSVVYVYPLLETNKRLKLIYTASMGDSRSTAVASKGDDAQRLDAYFPFDPYKLPRSKRWIENDYREWQGVPGLDDGEDSGSESDGEGEDGDGASDGTETDEEE